MSEKLYRVQMNSKGMPDFSTAVEVADRPQGEWISKHNGYWTCSECGLSFLFYAKGNYCPNCGARMKGADDE